MDLPLTTTDAPPAFLTTDECRDWLQRQSANQPVQVQAALLRQLNLLNRYTLPAAERLSILELLRGPVHEVQEENARRFVGKALPLAQPEQVAFDTCLAIWNALANNYLHCLVAGVADEPGMKEQRALTAQRALATLTAAQFDTCRGGHLLPGSHWRRLHQTYVLAEQAEVARQEVADELRLGRNMATVEAAWVEALLLQAASLHEQAPKQMGWIARWAQRWAAKIKAYQSPPTMSARAIPLCVDVDSEQPAGYRPVFVAGARFLDTSALRSSLKKRIMALEAGDTPKELHLGDDCTQPQCGQLLVDMYYRWCKGGARRRHERQESSGSCSLVGEFEAIHYYLSGRKPLAVPTKALTDTQIRNQREEIATFGRVKEVAMDNFSEQQGYQQEQWQLVEEWHAVDQSASGFHAKRPAGKVSGRYSAGQLLAIKRADSKQVDKRDMHLGILRWVLLDATQTLQAGIETLSVKPQPVAVRGTGMEASGAAYAPAFLLPGNAEQNEPPSIVTPPGYFRRERVLEILTGSATTIRLTGIIDRGSDFERASYE